MSKYSDREKRGHFNQLRGSASHLGADLKLLGKLDPDNELLSSKISKEKLADKVLFALLDHATRCDIVDFRREYSRFEGLTEEQYKCKLFVDNYNKNIVMLMGKFGVDTELDSKDKIKYVFDKLGFTPYIENVASEDNQTIFDLVGCTLRDCNLLETIEDFDVDEDIISEDQIRVGIIDLITKSIERKNARHEEEFALAYKAKLEAYIQKVGEDFVFSSVEEIAIMFQMLGLPMPDPKNEGDFFLADLIGIPFKELPYSKHFALTSEVESVINRYKSAKKTEVEVDAGDSEIEDKERELSERESDLDEKEQELSDKEEELAEKEAEIESKQTTSKKKAVAKKKNTQK